MPAADVKQTLAISAGQIDGYDGRYGFRCREANEPFAIRDSRLIMGQQQYGSGFTAERALDALDE